MELPIGTTNLVSLQKDLLSVLEGLKKEDVGRNTKIDMTDYEKPYGYILLYKTVCMFCVVINQGLFVEEIYTQL